MDQAKLTYQDPSQKEAVAGVRGALGKAYEQQLRAEADAVAPGKLSKRKHQINSLYHAAKMKVRITRCTIVRPDTQSAAPQAAL